MERIIRIIFTITSVVLFILSYLQLDEQGFLINKAYIKASKEERENMNKRPYYRQSGIIFLLLGLSFLLSAFNTELKSIGLLLVSILLIALTIVYTNYSTKKINKK